MIKRHGLVVFLFCFSIILGIAIALFEAATVFFFSIGILFLAGLAAALFAAVTISWLTLKRKSHIRNPEQSVRHQGTAFGVWFAVHNLSWAFAGSFFIWGVFKLFGFKPWVMIFSAGALACTCFALIGTFLIRQREMLGLCWQSSIPDGLGNFWARAGATMILKERYEYAAEHDQKQHTPLLWSISRIFNRSKAGGADRGIDLIESPPGFLAKKLKKEWLHRFKVLLVLFLVTAALAALSGVLFASHHWDRVPDGWPSDKIKASKPGKPQMMASKPSPP
jgi:MFS family permease